MPAKHRRKGYFVQLPAATIAAIKRVAGRTGRTQWQVVVAWAKGRK